MYRNERLVNLCRWSSVGRKLLTGLTGLGMVTFVTIHLLGNLTLLLGPDAFNRYADSLEHLLHGAFLYLAEAGLLLFFGVHVVTAITLYLDHWRARDVDYEVKANAGGPSQKGLASTTMIVTGLVLLTFLILHLLHFKFGPGRAAGYVTTVDGRPLRDLYRLVIEEFHKPVPAFGYAAVMLLLGLHLRHGFWSAFQSLGAGSARLTPVLRGVGIAVAILLAAGFVGLPLYVFFALKPVAVAAGVAAGGPGL